MTPQLEYPFDTLPATGETLQVAPGVHWIRMPLPFALNHINLWLIEDGDGVAIVAALAEDTGNQGHLAGRTFPFSVDSIARRHRARAAAPLRTAAHGPKARADTRGEALLAMAGARRD